MVLFSTTLLSGYCRGITALPAAVAAAVVVAAGVAIALPGKCITRCRVLALGCLVCLSLSRSPFLSLCLFGEARGPFDPIVIPSLFGCYSGCSPDSSTASRRPHVWSAVHTDPPCVLPPCHVSHITLHLH